MFEAMAAGAPANPVESRAQEARELVLHAQRICSAVALVLKTDSPDGKLDGSEAETCRQALMAASDILNRVAGALEPRAARQARAPTQPAAPAQPAANPSANPAGSIPGKPG